MVSRRGSSRTFAPGAATMREWLAKHASCSAPTRRPATPIAGVVSGQSARFAVEAPSRSVSHLAGGNHAATNAHRRRSAVPPEISPAIPVARDTGAGQRKRSPEILVGAGILFARAKSSSRREGADRAPRRAIPPRARSSPRPARDWALHRRGNSQHCLRCSARSARRECGASAGAASRRPGPASPAAALAKARAGGAGASSLERAGRLEPGDDGTRRNHLHAPRAAMFSVPDRALVPGARAGNCRRVAPGQAKTKDSPRAHCRRDPSRRGRTRSARAKSRPSGRSAFFEDVAVPRDPSGARRGRGAGAASPRDTGRLRRWPARPSFRAPRGNASPNHASAFSRARAPYSRGPQPPLDPPGAAGTLAHLQRHSKGGASRDRVSHQVTGWPRLRTGLRRGCYNR